MIPETRQDRTEAGPAPGPERAKRVEGLPRTVRDALCVLVLAGTDIAATFGAVALAWTAQDRLAARLALRPMNVLSLIDCAQLLAVAVVAGFFLRGLYLRREPLWETLRLTLNTLAFSLAFAVAVLFLTRIVDGVPRSLALLSGLGILAVVPPARLAALRLLAACGAWPLRAAVVGLPRQAEAVAADLEADFALGYRVVSRHLPETAAATLPSPLDEVVVAAAGIDPDTLARLVADLHRRAPAVTLVPDFGPLPFVRGMTRFLFDQERVLMTTRNLLKDPANLLVKRAFDVAVSLALLVPALPLMLTVAAAVRLTSPGPALFSQSRIGRNGRRFRCLKFRTMYRDAEERLAGVLASDAENRTEWERFHKLTRDPRVTPLGDFLRRTSLDELPQLLNVLAGSMSLVGPRPLPDYHYEKFREPHASDYVEVKPGITGLWQVGGRADADVERMAALNSWYVRNWSLWIDVTLVMRTVPAVLRRRGAR